MSPICIYVRFDFIEAKPDFIAANDSYGADAQFTGTRRVVSRDAREA